LDDPGQSVVSIMAAISEAKLAAMLAGTPKEEGAAAGPEVIGKKEGEAEEATPKKGETKGETAKK
jgi:hypothetical protein